MAEQFTAEQIAKIAPHYKGKPEKFNPQRIKSKKGLAELAAMNKTPKQDAQQQPSTPRPTAKVLTLPKPQLAETNKQPTSQRNESIISEAIFGQNVTVVPIAPRQQFEESFAAVPQIALEVYREYAKDVTQIDRKMIKEEMSYYFTALLWLHLIDIKAKNGLQALTREEKTIHKDTKDEIFNVPQPMYTYLASIGSIVDKMGKRTFLETPTLPTAQAGGFGGYHAAAINEDTHNLFEEIPSLGIAGDMLMAAAGTADEPARNFRVAYPANATFSNNLLGQFPVIGPSRAEIRQKLASFGITNAAFDEYCQHTRFHRQYIRDLSDTIGKWETFKVEKVNLQSMTSDGATVQAIMSRPIHDEQSPNWQKRTVQNTSAEDETTAIMGAAFVFRFQLFKIANDGGTRLIRNSNWCCVTSADEAQPYDLPEEWVINRNQRRHLPDVLECERFRAIAMDTGIATEDAIRRMVKTSR